MTDLIEAPESPEPRRRFTPKSAREMIQPGEVPPPPTRSAAARHPLVVSLNFFVTIAVVAVVVIGGIALFAKVQFDADGPLEEQRTVQIAQGMGVGQIATMLQQLGIITNSWVFRAGVAVTGAEADLQAGEYLIEARASMRDILDQFVNGDVTFYTVTVPEGLTSYQIVALLLAHPDLVGEITEVPPEGTLLPDTFRFNSGDTRQGVLDRMRRDHDRVVAEIWANRAEGLPITTPEQLVILASIVEKETGIADERSRVAAVFINRLIRGMRLQSDPTILYGIYGGQGNVTGAPILQSQLNAQTAYNTYQIDGLPPGPIANPGRAALEAVANPSRTNDLYFVADGTGGHAFADTLEEHNRNVERWRAIERQRAAQTPPPTPAPDPAAP